jgi:tripartite-type tricarboxylate transporter receptor subunit TctC
MSSLEIILGPPATSAPRRSRARYPTATRWGSSGPIFINPNLTKVAYDPIKDFAPIAYLGASPNVILTSPNSAFANIQQMISEAKANPGKINFATPGAGSVSHLSVEFLKLRAGINLVHVPYSGAAPAAQAAIARTTDLASVNISGMLGHVQSGALRALVQTGKERWPEMPDVPTLVQSGIRDAVLNDAVFARAGRNTARDHRPSLKRGACDPAEARCPGPDVKGELCRERRGS